MTATRFAAATNIFTGHEIIDLVPIPELPGRGAKGTTFHDAKFNKLMEFKQAVRVPENEFSAVRKALQRYIKNKGLQGTVSARQRKDVKTKSYTVWLVNQPPKTSAPRSEK
jgi:hypothetical protein